jgi:hypothetical protein
MDLLSGELGAYSGMCATSSEVGNEVIRVKLEGITGLKEEENLEPMTSPLIETDPVVGFMSVECSACFIVVQNCLSVLVKQ